ncbi:MAG: hypothetical protein MZV70_70800 [Desulfobacterales bacterium]|nr:hypothetical protein [Desulfobacterales bacterium]
MGMVEMPMGSGGADQASVVSPAEHHQGSLEIKERFDGEKRKVVAELGPEETHKLVPFMGSFETFPFFRDQGHRTQHPSSRSGIRHCPGPKSPKGAGRRATRPPRTDIAGRPGVSGSPRRLGRRYHEIRQAAG